MRLQARSAARLHAADPAAYPARVGAEWLSGEHAATHRRDILTRYADGIDAEGWVCELSFLASCRVLGEKVDIRGKRGVGAVVFADTRSSPVEIVQIIGRALRQEPSDGKVSRILVPVFLEPGEDPGDMMASSSYWGLVAILQGLRAHDDRAIERMALPTTTARGQITSVLALDPQAPADRNGNQDDKLHGEDDGQKQDEEREPAAAGTNDDSDQKRVASKTTRARRTGATRTTARPRASRPSQRRCCGSPSPARTSPCSCAPASCARTRRSGSPGTTPCGRGSRRTGTPASPATPRSSPATTTAPTDWAPGSASSAGRSRPERSRRGGWTC